MAYTQRYAGGFVNGNNAKQVDDVFLNAVETALLKLLSADGTVDGQVMQWIQASSKFGPALLLNKNVDPAAAIDKSKLNLAGQIVDADIAGAAAIAKSKLGALNLVNADVNAAAAIALSKLADPGSGKVLTSLGAGAIAAFPPGYELGRVTRTTDFTTTGTTFAAGGDLFASDVSFTADGSSSYLVEAYASQWYNTGANQIVASLKLDSADSGIAQLVIVPAAGNSLPFNPKVILTPSAAVHTVNFRIWSTSASTTTVRAGTLGAGNNVPAFIRVTKI